MGIASLALALALAAIAAGGYVFSRRYGGGRALEELERANRILERRVLELEHENTALHTELEVLRTRTDFAVSFAPVQEQLREQHDAYLAATRQTHTLLAMIAERLGADPNGD